MICSHAVSGVPGRPGLTGELRQSDLAAPAARHRVVGGQHQVNRIPEEVLAVDAGRPSQRLMLPFVGQDEVDIAERERGQRLLGFGLDELAAQLGRLSGERPHRRDGQAERDRLEGRDPPAAGDAAPGRCQLGLRDLGPLEQFVRVACEDERSVGHPDPATGRLEQGHACLTLEDGELLGDGRGRELEGLGHRGDGAPRAQLAEEAKPVEVEHS